jgi:transposase
MDRSTAKQLDKKTLFYLRKRVITLREKGYPNKEIATLLNLDPATTSKWYSKYKKEGKEALKPKKAGRPKESGRRLSKEQESHIVRLLIEKNPKQLKFKFALWTREAVKQLIERETEQVLPLSTVGYYLQRWQFTAKKPIKRAYERKDEKTQQWLNEEYPKIKKQAKADNADIWWADETACVSLPSYIRGYAPKGSHYKPILTHPAKKFKINMISAITNTGKTMFALYEENINVDRFIDFLQRVIDSSQKKIYMIVDNLRVHHAKLVKQWLAENKEKIALFYLPPYAPEYNPDEYLNQDFKRNVNKDKIPYTQTQLKKNTISYMESIVNDKQKVRNFFKHPSIAYAA